MKSRPQERFSSVAKTYASWRPSYPKELFERVAQAAKLAPGATVVDVGCGTGISTRLWAELGYRAVGVEPNDAMRAEAVAAGGVAHLSPEAMGLRDRALSRNPIDGDETYRKGDAEKTGLPEHLADLVAAAQAFHWFELDRALAEFSRVLKPGAKCAAIWNQRARTPLLKEYEALLSRFAAEYNDRPKSADVLAKITAHPRVVAPVSFEITHAQTLDREGFFGRVYSASYVALSLSDKKGFDAALEALFAKFQKDGRVAFDYRAVAVVFALR